MISNKKSYAMKMLQLALALSLLHVDPDSYLQQRLRNWDSQLELRHGDGNWELEMLRAVPMVEYPYANRKTMMPLIEDLIRFDRERDSHPSQQNVTAYLLNVSNENVNTTAAMQEMQAIPVTTSSSVSSNPTATSSSSAGTAVLVESNTPLVNSIVTGQGSMNATRPVSPEIELFLNSDLLQDQRSVWEQNLADLNDFNDLPHLNTHYGNLPLKDGQQENNLFDLQLDAFLPTFSSLSTNSEEAPEGATALNDTFPNPEDSSAIKLEQLDDEDDKVLLSRSINARLACSVLSPDAVDIDNAVAAASAEEEICIKKEEPDCDDDDDDDAAKDSDQDSAIGGDVDLSPFISTVELTEEESEIVEVLWKQDVDLGYSLTPQQLAEAGIGSATLDKGALAGTSEDDIEKLKALEALKLDNPKLDDDSKDFQDAVVQPSMEDEWSGIPFTIDHETGEYIRLPLDDILNDVIQFAELAGENNEDDSSEASTSKAAANGQLKSDNDDKPDKIDLKLKVKSQRKQLKSESEKDNSDWKKDNQHKSVFDNLDSDIDDDDGSDNDSDIDSDSSLPSPLFDLDDEAKEELADLDMMLHSSTPFHHHHHHHHHPHAHAHRAAGAAMAVGGQQYGGANSAFHRQPSSGGFPPHGHHQGRMSLSRGVSMEQRLQDIASLFPSMGIVPEMSPYSHYSTHPYSYQTAPHQAQYPHPPPPPPPHHHAMLHANASLGELCSSTQPHYGHNLGSAVTSSMHLTNSTHDADVAAGAVGGAAGAAAGAYKMEHDMMYYSNASSDMNHTTDGFINSILNDEDLHLMDMNVNDNFCRMVDVNNSTSNNSSVLGLPTGVGSHHQHHLNHHQQQQQQQSHHHSLHGNTNSASATASGLAMSGSAASATGAAGAIGPATMTDLMSASGGAQAGATDRLDASSDSAVSSMGSERVPSLSDGEWGEGSDSAQDFHQGKYGGPYDYSYNNGTPNGNRLNDGSRQPPVAQKKHHMFGKRFLNEQPGTAAANAATAANGGILHTGPAASIKYEYEPYPSTPVAGLHHSMSGSGPGGIESGGAMGPVLTKDHQQPHPYGNGYSLDFSLPRTPRTPHEIVQHNHTYTLPQGTGSLPRPQQRDKKSSASSKAAKAAAAAAAANNSSGGEEDNYLTRDEKRARAMNIPIAVTDIINLPMDEFNERLSKYDLSENQLSLIRDIRRRGKNKVAAQNCRKRKLDQILSLEDEVKQVRRRKEDLQDQRERVMTERKRVSNKFSALHRHIFQYLRDPEGNPCSPSEYSLQQAADGSIYLLRRDSKNDSTTNGILNGAAAGTNTGANANSYAQQQHTTHQAMPAHNIAQLHHNHHQHHTPPQQQQQHHHSHHQVHGIAHHQQQQQQTNGTVAVVAGVGSGAGVAGSGGATRVQPHQPQKD